MKHILPIIALLLISTLLSGCALTKVITVPVKAAATVVGGTADVID